ncbi:MAG: pyridoxal-phosphate dependent enzyme [Acidimicrobiia bacterium]|nr:pyridoxal-phosphate dependent enzyme [Acidimicrobiia bacterium]
MDPGFGGTAGEEHVITLDGIVDAAYQAHARIHQRIRQTPLEMLGDPADTDRAFAKCENLQLTGSFKVRGAMSALSAAADHGIERVIAASTGNHGAAVAFAGHSLDIDVTVYSPVAVDPSKLAAMRRWGASVELVAGDPVLAETTARAAATADHPYISPYNDAAVIAGQATIGVELLQQLPRVDTLVASVGGGGLISGIAAVLKASNPDVHVVGVSPANSAVMLRSVAAGAILDIESAPTLSDGTAGGVEPGSITFELCRGLVDTWLEVDEPAIRRALSRYIGTYHQLIEGAAAVTLAGLNDPATREIGGGTTVAILCGANIAPSTLRSVLDPAPG